MSGRINAEGFEKNIKLMQKFAEVNGLDMVDPYKDETGAASWTTITGWLRTLNTHLQLAYAEIDQLRMPAPVKSTTQIITDL